MKKLMFCLVACLLLSVQLLQAQDTGSRLPDSARQSTDSATRLAKDTSLIQSKDTSSIQPKDSSATPLKDTSSPKMQDAPAQSAHDTSVKIQDTSSIQPNDGDKTATLPAPAADTAQQQPRQPTRRELDNRWFISPLLKLQFQDFGMLEKDRKGYLSDANTLPFLSRGNASFAASAYKNLTNRFSFSADLGLSFGHSTNDSILISQTKSKTYNLLNATVYFHLLSPGYRLQPFLAIGINDIVSDASYLTAPLGFGAKFNSRHIMVEGEVAYGYAVTKNIAPTTMYSLGIYIPVANKKKKLEEDPDVAAYNRTPKNDTAKHNGIVNNFYITIKMDSLNKANHKGDGDDDDIAGNLGKNGRHKKGSGGDGADGDDNGSDQPFKLEDARVDTVDGRPVYHFFVYFEFNQYSLNSKAFSTVDRAISQLHSDAGSRILINGYTDDVGTVPQNNWVSRKRSQMVFDYMNSRGIGSERMVPKYFGKDNPVASNEDPNTAWLNRRVEIIVQDKDK